MINGMERSAQEFCDALYNMDAAIRQDPCSEFAAATNTQWM
jgi:hypothetical protein